MANPYRITLDDASLRWAAAEGVPESVIAAVFLLDEKSVDEIVARLTTAELEQVIKIVGRSPRGYAPGAYAALKEQLQRRSVQKSAACASPAEGPNAPTARINPGNESTHPTRLGVAARNRMTQNPEMVVTTVPARSAAAERMRQHRERRQQGLRCLMIEISETQIEGLIRQGSLPAEWRNESFAVSWAVYDHLDRTLVQRP